MKRPLAVIGFTMLSALFVFGEINSIGAMGIAFAAILIAFFVSVSVRRLREFREIAAILLSALVAVGILMIRDCRYIAAAEKYENSTVTVSGSLESLPYYSNGNYCYVIKTCEIDGVRENQKIFLRSTRELNLKPTDRITLSVRLNRPGLNSDSYVKYYKSANMMFSANVSDTDRPTVHRNSAVNPKQYILLLREKLLDNMLKYSPDDVGAVICSLVLGEKSRLSDEAESAFRACGVTHMFSVSGLHVSIWSLLIFSMFRRLGLSRRKSSAVSIGYCVFFMFLAGLNTPVVRAGIMMIILFAGELFSRESDSYNSIGLALILILLINPYAALSVGLWLSVLSTLGILLLAPDLTEIMTRRIRRCDRRIRACCEPLVQIVAVTLCSTLFTLPVCIFVFGCIPTLSLATNLIMILPGSMCMELGGIGSALMLFGLSLSGRILMHAALVLSEFLLGCALRISKPGFAVLTLGTSGAKLALCAATVCAVAVLFIVLKRHKRKTKALFVKE